MGLDSPTDPTLTADTVRVTVSLYADKQGKPSVVASAHKDVELHAVPATGALYSIDVSDSNFVTWSWVSWVGASFNSCGSDVRVVTGFEYAAVDAFFHNWNQEVWDPLFPSFDIEGDIAVYFRTEGEAVTVGQVGAPPGWTCNISRYFDGRTCDCFCGSQDPDCVNPSLPTVGCPASYTCSEKSVCISLGAACDRTHWGTFDGCHCGSGCSEMDPDCHYQVSQQVLGCPKQKMGCQNNECYIPFWSCAEFLFDDGQKCNCNCGNIDPDCANTSLPVVGCMMDNSVCRDGACVAAGWTCYASFYNARDGCDCLICGTIDPDCADDDQEVFSCSASQSCSANNTCVASNICGNWRREGDEECDSGLGCVNCKCGEGYIPSGDDALSVDCKNVCGDGRVVYPEECDSGFLCANCRCSSTSQAYDPPLPACGPACGNGIIDEGEECDGGDGCTNCQCGGQYKQRHPAAPSCRRSWLALGLAVGLSTPALIVIFASLVTLLIAVQYFHKRVAILTQPGSLELVNTPAAEAVKQLQEIKKKGASKKLSVEQLLSLDHIIGLIATDRLHVAEYTELKRAGLTRSQAISWIIHHTLVTISCCLHGDECVLSADTDFETDAFIMENLVDVSATLAGIAKRISSDISIVENLQAEAEGGSCHVIDLNSWDFSAFDRLDPAAALPLVAVGAFYQHGLFNKFGIDTAKFQRWVWLVNNSYTANPYHNALHAADVVQAMNVCLGHMNGLPPLYVLAAIFAAIIHDVGHPGLNNNFLYRTFSKVAMLYNGISILENMHTNLGFDLLLNQQNWLPFDKDQLIEFHQIATQLVLSTDMSQHVEIISHLSTRVAMKPLDLTLKADAVLALQCVIKLCDLCNLMRPWAVCEKWATRITEEFFRQGDLEAEAGLPKSPFMDRSAPRLAKCQLAFHEFVVAPAVTAVVPHVVPGLLPVITANMQDNFTHWKNAVPPGEL
eukprot:TRINITY_DN1019_c0_g1_i1.p1 TRINITY_DN1019_c0_g1~~TRINITY_DN1019_c0_g1_i1.p1  ORF type:complete len:1046 (-),score=173.00 TRINITY_DN1019_c0_g1_i1:68-2944(-)